jgi:hypothetical protein
MSRIITQQVTRHRNGITQESQRYVNYTGAMFNSPAKFKDKYDPHKIYKTSVGNYTMESLGEVLTLVYGELVNQGVEKEDARGYLPGNTQCGKLYMTFTLRALMVFLHLRLDSHAQAEVRLSAEDLGEITSPYAYDLDVDDMWIASAYYSEPLYKRIENTDCVFVKCGECAVYHNASEILDVVIKRIKLYYGSEPIRNERNGVNYR